MEDYAAYGEVTCAITSKSTLRPCCGPLRCGFEYYTSIAET